MSANTARSACRGFFQNKLSVRFPSLAVAVIAVLFATANLLGEPTSPRDMLKLIHVPPGFSVELVAEAPAVEHPMMACFDERGRLFVAENAGVNLNADQLLKNPPSSIRMLEDTVGNGHFDKSTTYADKLVFPQGVCWVDGALFTASPPNLWRLRDTTGTGVADERREWVGSFGFTGNAADIHGPVLGPDGFLYFCDGRHGHRIPQSTGPIWTGNAARIFRCRPNGNDLEVVCGGGMDNPVKATFTAEGEPLVGVNLIHAKPQRVDGIIYALEGSVFPYHAALSEFKTTGPLFEPVDNLGWVAVAGIVRNRGKGLGDEYQNNLFSCQFNPHRVQRHIVKRDGGGFRISNEDFLTCGHPDFHPTDVIEDADGSLLLVNTGGWFRIGCPNSQLAKPDVRGAIYRIRKTDSPKVEDPRGLKLAWDTCSPNELAMRLGDPRIFVQDRAIAALAKLGKDACPALSSILTESGSVDARRNAVWALTRIVRPEARDAARFALSDTDASVRQVAVTSVGTDRDVKSVRQLLEMLKTETPSIRRECATALGRIGTPDAVGPLLAELRTSPDRFIEHAIIYALIRIDDRFAVMKMLSDADPAVVRGALIAMDQMPNGGLGAEQVSPLLSSSEPAVRTLAAEIVARHPMWSASMATYLQREIPKIGSSVAEREALKQQISAFGRAPVVQAVVAMALSDKKTPAETRELLFEAIAQSPVDQLSDVWRKSISDGLEDKDERVCRQAVIASRLQPDAFAAPLIKVANHAGLSDELRIEAISVITPRVAPLAPALFELLVSNAVPTKPLLLRSSAADAIGSSHLDTAQLERVVELIPSAGPLELPSLLTAFNHNSDPDLGRKLIVALDTTAASRSLRLELVNLILREYPAEVKQAAIPLLRQISGAVDQQKARLEELSSTLSGGNAERGSELFHSNKLGCSICHSVGGHGGNVGPDLSKIGQIRSPRDLLEAVVYPSASFARGYEPWLVKTRDNDVLSGLISQQTADAIYLTTGPRETRRILRGQIADLRPGTVSLMPQGFDTQLSHDELADLIAFVASLK